MVERADGDVRLQRSGSPPAQAGFPAPDFRREASLTRRPLARNTFAHNRNTDAERSLFIQAGHWRAPRRASAPERDKDYASSGEKI
jgi:hypothetical protein